MKELAQLLCSRSESSKTTPCSVPVQFTPVFSAWIAKPLAGSQSAIISVTCGGGLSGGSSMHEIEKLLERQAHGSCGRAQSKDDKS